MSSQVSKSFATTRNAPRADRCSRISAIWAAFDAAQSPITSKHLPEMAEKCGLSPVTVRIQFYAWRAHNPKAVGARTVN